MLCKIYEKFVKKYLIFNIYITITIIHIYITFIHYKQFYVDVIQIACSVVYLFLIDIMYLQAVLHTEHTDCME